jgi:hypothetical protein
LRSKLVNPPPMVLRLKPPNPLMSSVLHMRPPPLDTCHRRPRPAGTPSPLSLARPARSPSRLGQHRHSHVFLHLSMSATAASHPASGSSVQASRPSFTALGLSARHVLLDLHLAIDHRIRAPHLHNTSQETCRIHSFRHARVSHHSTYFVDHIDNHSL